VPEAEGAIAIVGGKLDQWRGHGRSMAGARSASTLRKARRRADRSVSLLPVLV
jgi:hypothetical protein